MKRYLLTISFILTLVLVYAQDSQWLWAISAGGIAYNNGYSITSDNQDNLYITGEFSGTAILGSTTLTSDSGDDFFAAKLDSDGNFLWAVSACGTSLVYGYSIAVDDSGNCYVTGVFRETATFGTTTLTSNSWGDIFIAKLDSNGNWLWIRQAGGAYGDSGFGIAVDNSGNCYVIGYFMDTASFGSTTLATIAECDIFVVKLDTEGNWLWVKQSGETVSGWVTGYGIDVDSSGNSYVTGYFNGTVTIGSTGITSSGYTDLFAAKLNTNGDWLWVKKAGGTGDEYSLSIAVDVSGNSYITGFFAGNSVHFGTISISSSGNDDIFAAKLDTNGNWLWAKKAGGLSADRGNGISVDSFGNSYVTGYFRFAATFDTITLNNSNEGENDIFIAKLDTNGNWVGADKAGGAYDDSGNSIAIDRSGNSFITGSFIGTAYVGNTSLTSNGETNIFVAKLTPELTWIEDEFITETAVRSHVYGNYPNPFNPETTIKYYLDKTQEAKLDIFNLKGQLIKTLVSETKASGEHSVLWKGEDESGHFAASGIYIVKMQTGNLISTKKMILMK